MNGEAGKGESMLRQAASADGQSPRIRQNLALVLGLQGKYDEAKLIAARDMPITNASENADYLRQVVKLDPKSVPSSEPGNWNTQSNIAELPAVNAVPVEKVARLSEAPIADPAAADDTGWVVSDAKPVAPKAAAAEGGASAASSPKLLSVSEMAAQFAVADDEAPQEAKKRSAPKGTAQPAQLAQAKR
jgi:hypothetical protein